MIDLFIRAETRARWLAFASNRNIIVNGELQPGYAVDELGNVELTPAVMNGMEVVTPAVIDTWWWVNLRIYGPKFTADQDTVYAGENDPVDADGQPRSLRFIRSKIVKFVRNQATQLTFNGWRVYQFGTSPNRIQLIDPRDYTPKRVWFGGMSI